MATLLIASLTPEEPPADVAVLWTTMSEEQMPIVQRLSLAELDNYYVSLGVHGLDRLPMCKATDR
ncbi:hypothetical protein CHR28_25085 [Streptomyces sp. XY006]|nr:hypothetical protein CHR28_25085 [Streptomyces sp. XY006]